MGDHSLAAFPVAVQDVEHHRVASFDCGGDGLELGCGRVPQGSLPESDVTGCQVNVAGLGSELLQRRIGLLRLPGDLDVPAVHDGEPRADVPDRDHHVHDAVGDLQGCGAAAATGAQVSWAGEDFAELTTSSATLAIASTRTVPLFAPGAARPADNNTVIIEFLVDDVDGVHQNLAGFAGDFVTGPTTMP